MHHAVAGDQRAVAHLDPSGEQRASRDDGGIADAAIVRGMRVLHEEVVVPDNSHLALLAAAMNRGALAKDVAMADANLARSAGIREVLRLIADDDIRMQHVRVADFGIAENRDMADEPRARADANFSFEQTERADLDIGGQLNIIADDRTGMNARGGRISALQLRCLLFLSASAFRSSSGCSVSSTALPAIRYFSLAHVPRSIIWHRSEQNGRNRLAGERSTGFLQIAHRI